MLYYFSTLDTNNDSYGYIWSDVSLSLDRIELSELYRKVVDGLHVKNVNLVGRTMYFQRERIYSFRAMRYSFAWQSPENIFISSPKQSLCNLEINMGSLYMNGRYIFDCKELFVPFLSDECIKMAYTRDGYSFDSLDLEFMGSSNYVYSRVYGCSALRR